MLKFQRCTKNPIISPNPKNDWEAKATFNPSVAKSKSYIYLLYRALSNKKKNNGIEMPVSSIGYKMSTDGINFSDCGQLIKPEKEWEKFGCEDPRITKLEDKYYIFYTALSKYPFQAKGIKIGLATTKSFDHLEKHLVTRFNSKAMAVFPERINGKIAALLTVDTDKPPAKICLAFFDDEAEIWSKDYWENWYKNLESHIIPLLESGQDHIELGAPPVKTKKGWLLFYSYIENYFSSSKVFTVKAVLMDKDLQKIIGKSDQALLLPEADYELKGRVPEIVFPSGGIKENGNIYLYYGAADNFGCMAHIKKDSLLNDLTKEKETVFLQPKTKNECFQRFSQNPIIKPRPEFKWEAKATFNPAAIYKNGKTHIIYRAMSQNNTSVLGYALTKDGVNIDQRSSCQFINLEKTLKKNQPGG